MGHYQQLRFVEICARHVAPDWAGKTVVEIGSYSVNSTIRPLFKGSHYTGVDLVAGDGVDLVASGDAVDLPDRSVDLAISCECFEHNPRWAPTFVNMHRMTRDGGIVLMTCASTGRREHGTARTTPAESPGTTSVGWDYYRNLTRADFESAFDLKSLFSEHAFFVNDVSNDLYFIGRRHGQGGLRLDLPQLWIEIDSVNTQVRRVEPFRPRRVLGWMLEQPAKLARWLPEKSFQSFMLRWPGIERSIRDRFSSRS